MDKEAIVKNVQDKFRIESILKDIPHLKGNPVELMAYFEDIKKKYDLEFVKAIFKEIEKKGHLNNINKTTWEPIYDLFKIQCPINENLLKAK